MPGWTKVLFFQKLRFVCSHHCIHPQGQRIGLLQPKNGPCGVLAVVNAAFIAQCMNQNIPSFGLNFIPTDQLLAEALATIIQKAKADGPCKVAQWKGKKPPVHFFQWRLDVVGEDISLENVQDDQLVPYLEKHIGSFKGRGGVVLFLYSVVFSRGISQVSKIPSVSFQILE